MRHPTLHKSAGVALVTAIFLLVVLAGLAVAVVSLTTSQQSSSAQDMQGQRAYQAAKSGMEWALYQALPNTGGSGLSCTTPITFVMPPGTTLSTFTVTITCTAVAGKVAIKSTACNAPLGFSCPVATPGPDYVQRVITAQI